MHGLGNDYIVIDDRRESIEEKSLPRLAIKLCKRGFSVGADGLLLVRQSKDADIRMRIFNLDGSEAEMCGNGIRCIAKYCYDNGVVQRKMMDVETLAGIRRVEILAEKKNSADVRTEMGTPSFKREDIPFVGRGECIDEPITIDGTTLNVTCVSMGNPHCVTFINDLETFPVQLVGSKLEKHPHFPEGTNVEFVTVQGKERISIRTWERGVGETPACGTGACASVVAAHRLGKTGKRVNVTLLGGNLLVELGPTVTLEGSVEKIFEGQLFVGVLYGD